MPNLHRPQQRGQDGQEENSSCSLAAGRAGQGWRHSPVSPSLGGSPGVLSPGLCGPRGSELVLLSRLGHLGRPEYHRGVGILLRASLIRAAGAPQDRAGWQVPPRVPAACPPLDLLPLGFRPTYFEFYPPIPTSRQGELESCRPSPRSWSRGDPGV